MVGVCLVDREGRLTHMNLAGSRLLGWGAACPTNVSCHDLLECLVPCDEAGTTVCPFSGLLLEKTMVWVPRTRLRRRQGTWCWVELKGLVVDDAEASGFLLMFRDLSSEMKLTEETRRLASIPKENPFPVIEVDSAGQLLYANPAMVRLMEEAHIGQDGFSTALPDRFLELAKRCLSQKHLEMHYEVSVGERQYSWTFAPHADLGLLRGYGMDITEPKRAAEELSAFADTLEAKNHELDQALMKAESATRAKAAFLAVMSHEIRTPLNGVIGMAEVLLASSLNHEQQECVNIIRLSGEGLLTIINDILDFSKLESGQLALESMGFNLTSLFEEVVDLFSERAHRKGLDLAAYVDPDVPSQLFGDPHRLRQILCNYLSNSLKFTMEGSVLLRGSLILPSSSDCDDSLGGLNHLSGDPDDKTRLWIHLSVQDTGLGMSEEVQEKIFHVFTQADSSMSRKFGGSGLGLAICKQLAELMHGTVGVKSQPNQGSTFWCDIPCRASRTAHSPATEGISVADKEVWVIGPQDSSGWVMAQLLHEVRVKVVQIDSIQQAITLYGSVHESDCSVVGVILSDRLGKEAVLEWFERLRSSSLFQELKVWGMKPFWYRKDDEENNVRFDGMITLPLHRKQFFYCLFGQPDHPGPSDSPRATEPHPVEIMQRRIEVLEQSFLNKQAGPSVLVVEDNPVNQRVAAGMLGKLGCQVTIVNTGAQALTVLKESVVDCILMDWELPDMDGLVITQRIRELEHAGAFVHSAAYWHRHHGSASPPVLHIPIVGMTAHVLSEDGQQCLENGMDDCLFKPVHLGDLERILRRWIGFAPKGMDSSSSKTHAPADWTGIHSVATRESGAGHQERTSPRYPADRERYDVSAALQALEGDEELLYSLFHIFNATAPDLINGMHQTIHLQNRQELQRLAHQMKGALSAVHAMHEKKKAEQLELTAVSATFSHLNSTVIELERKVKQLICEFDRLIALQGEKEERSSEPISFGKGGTQNDHGTKAEKSW
jgi:signal transduction histidine kinase/CheY-like chemotaxis protein